MVDHNQLLRDFDLAVYPSRAVSPSLVSDELARLDVEKVLERVIAIFNHADLMRAPDTIECSVPRLAQLHRERIAKRDQLRSDGQATEAAYQEGFADALAHVQNGYAK